MRKFTALIIGFMVLVTAGSANAIVVDPAAAGLCQGPPSAPTGDRFVPNASPHCVCKPGQGDQERVNLQVPGTAALVKAVAQYGDFRDRCATVSEIKKGPPKPEAKKEKPVEAVKPTKPVAPIPPPSCEASDITATSNDASNKVFCTGAGVAKINRVVTTCDTCKPAIEDRTIVGPKTGALIYQVDVSKAQFQGQSSLVTVRFFTKDSKDVQTKYSVVWPTPVAPIAPVVPVPSACVKSNGIDGPNGTCVCLGDLELVPGQNICRPKPVPAPAPKAVEETGTYFHPYVGGMYGYGSSKSLKGSNGYFNVGLGIDIQPWLLGKIGVGTGGPGATRTYTDGTPVILANGNTDKRSSSFVADASVMLHFDWWGFDLGYMRQARGTKSWFNPTSPADVTGSVFFGPKVIWQLDQFAFVFGPDLLVGSHTMGSMPANTEVGVIVRLDLMLF
jgi:hypothetical protein